MQTATHTILSNIAAQALKVSEDKTAPSDRQIADMYFDGIRTFDEVAGAFNITRTAVVVALFRLNLLSGQQH